MESAKSREAESLQKSVSNFLSTRQHEHNCYIVIAFIHIHPERYIGREERGGSVGGKRKRKE